MENHDITFKNEIFNCFYLSQVSYEKNSSLISSLQDSSISDNHEIDKICGGYSTQSEQHFVIASREPKISNGFESRKTYYIAFRGTSCEKDILLDLAAINTYSAEGNFHMGFNLKSNYFPKQQIKEWLRQGCNVVLTGHSMGAAVATIIAINQLLNEGVENYIDNGQLVCITFGTPLLGCTKLANRINSCTQTKRSIFHFVVYQDDPIPKLDGLSEVVVNKIVELINAFNKIADSNIIGIIAKTVSPSPAIAAGIKLVVDLLAKLAPLISSALLYHQKKLFLQFGFFGDYHILKNDKTVDHIKCYSLLENGANIDVVLESNKARLREFLSFSNDSNKLTLENLVAHQLKSYKLNIINSAFQHLKYPRIQKITQLKTTPCITKIVTESSNNCNGLETLSIRVYGTNVLFIQHLEITINGNEYKVYKRKAIIDHANNSSVCAEFDLSDQKITHYNGIDKINFNCFFKSSDYHLVLTLVPTTTFGEIGSLKKYLVTSQSNDRTNVLVCGSDPFEKRKFVDFMCKINNNAQVGAPIFKIDQSKIYCQSSEDYHYIDSPCLNTDEKKTAVLNIIHLLQTFKNDGISILVLVINTLDIPTVKTYDLIFNCLTKKKFPIIYVYPTEMSFNDDGADERLKVWQTNQRNHLENQKFKLDQNINTILHWYIGENTFKREESLNRIKELINLVKTTSPSKNFLEPNVNQVVKTYKWLFGFSNDDRKEFIDSGIDLEHIDSILSVLYFKK